MNDSKEFKLSSSVVITLVIFVLFWVYSFLTKRKYKLPPGPKGLPFIGYLPFLGKDPARELYNLSKKYGDVYSINLAGNQVVVLTDAVEAKQFLNKQSTADRPEDVFIFLPGGGGFGESNGAEWVEQRRYTIKEMKNLGFGRSDWENHIATEASDLVDIIEKSKGQPFEINKELSASVSNNVLTLVSGQRLPRGHPKREIIDRGVEAFIRIYDQSGLIANFTKLYKFIAKIGLTSAAERLRELVNFNKCIRQQIEDIKQDKDGFSYIHKYLVEIEKNSQMNLGNFFNEHFLIGNVQSLIIAGSDTTKVSILWLFLIMASFPDIQKKVHKEVDEVLGKDGKVDWVDRNKLPYCYATICEAQRWRTVVPLNVLHRAAEDVVCNGYDIPKGTRIIALIYAFHNDPKYWKNPEIFQPERFLADDKLSVKEPEAYMPFSHGKRLCPGKTVALIEIFHYFVATMQKFRILPASETSPPDLEGTLGITLSPKYQVLRYVLR